MRAIFARLDMEGAQQALNIKAAELKRIKQLSRNLLKQRSEVCLWESHARWHTANRILLWARRMLDALM